MYINLYQLRLIFILNGPIWKEIRSKRLLLRLF